MKTSICDFCQKPIKGSVYSRGGPAVMDFSLCEKCVTIYDNLDESDRRYLHEVHFGWIEDMRSIGVEDV